MKGSSRANFRALVLEQGSTRHQEDDDGTCPQGAAQNNIAQTKRPAQCPLMKSPRRGEPPHLSISTLAPYKKTCPRSSTPTCGIKTLRARSSLREEEGAIHTPWRRERKDYGRYPLKHEIEYATQSAFERVYARSSGCV
ncbi:hypothetical protein KP509_26G045100 [Ceratopteris richardii]|uniref:Uncharacterized protein n=1 Tax=Ceratopteris richardii TaxID=49495 RepID=A0A8T2RKI3_CERRI|nr:hypothetical protein KP509_26G045100 [Ceratopteris richardii]